MYRTTLLMLIFTLTIKSCLPPCENHVPGIDAQTDMI